MEIFRALGALIEPPVTAEQSERLRIARTLNLAASESDLPADDTYTDLFLFQLYPYASVYLDAAGMMGGEARDRIAGFLRALGATQTQEIDHIAFLLAAYADLAAGDGDPGTVDVDPRRFKARKALLWEHLLTWIPCWLQALRRLGPPDYYLRWADLLEAALRREANRLGAPGELPLHLRQAPDVASPQTGATDNAFQGLLAPVRSGMILVRNDLRRAAHDLGLGLRAGERRYVVEHLLRQDAGSFLSWLEDEASHWARFWGGESWLGEVSIWWRRRAEECRETWRSEEADD
ncbi:MAG: molecular chaperone TorD family protein [Thermoanaerobaculia bacterium]|nr:molecular chaperone TorD family protein [Thermoanaerobaculia bacterium]